MTDVVKRKQQFIELIDELKFQGAKWVDYEDSNPFEFKFCQRRNGSMIKLITRLIDTFVRTDKNILVLCANAEEAKNMRVLLTEMLVAIFREGVVVNRDCINVEGGGTIFFSLIDRNHVGMRYAYFTCTDLLMYEQYINYAMRWK